MLYKMTIVLAALTMIACNSKESLKSALKDNPDILVEAIEAHPDKIITSLNNAARKAQDSMEKNRQAEEQKAMEESMEKPLEPMIRADETFRGPKEAPITLVIYSDFECPYCSRGHKNEQALMEKYKGKIRVVFKHLPLDFHPHAMIASQYYEAVRLQSGEKAAEFHDKVFDKQPELKKGEAFLKQLAKDLKVDMGRLAKDVSSEKVKTRIEEDMAEAQKFGFNGTPGYLLNGVPVRGAYPTEHFVDIIEKLQQKGKIQLQ
jgi:protein-disulfide isomerase